MSPLHYLCFNQIRHPKTKIRIMSLPLWQRTETLGRKKSDTQKLTMPVRQNHVIVRTNLTKLWTLTNSGSTTEVPSNGTFQQQFFKTNYQTQSSIYHTNLFAELPDSINWPPSQLTPSGAMFNTEHAKNEKEMLSEGGSGYWTLVATNERWSSDKKPTNGLEHTTDWLTTFFASKGFYWPIL